MEGQIQCEGKLHWSGMWARFISKVLLKNSFTIPYSVNMVSFNADNRALCWRAKKIAYRVCDKKLLA